MPEIDLILPTYNQAAFLDRALDSVKSQTFANFSLIAVNDGSTDSTPATLKKWAETDSRIQVINLNQNKGLPAALNIGHRAGKSPYCSWISSDNTCRANFLAVLHAAIIQCGVDFVQGKYLIHYPDNRTELKSREDNDCWGAYNLTPTFLYRRTVWETYGYDETMMGCEDLKFYLQAFYHPYSFHAVPDCLVDYYSHAESLTQRIQDGKLPWKAMMDKIYLEVVEPRQRR